jgi:hypothetical protein
MDLERWSRLALDLEDRQDRALARLPTPRPLISEPARAIQAPDGSFALVEAPLLAEFSLPWLATVGSANVVVDPAGNLVMGEVVYRPLYFQRATANPYGLLNLVCLRVHPPG